MKIKYLPILITAILYTSHINAQALFSGTVVESPKGLPLNNVFIRDITNRQVALTDGNGRFKIAAGLNHTLIFTSTGYGADTLFLVDLKPKRIELKIRGNTLKDVNITASSRGFDPHAEYPEIYRNSSFALSPSRIFGKKARDSRRLKHYFEGEIQQRQVDSIFNRAYVASIIPLKGKDLDDFITMYRPSLSFLKRSSTQTITLYINDSYRKFLATPADKRGLPSLNNP
jgi:hypothetical protein